MDFSTCTGEDNKPVSKMAQNNVLLEIIKEITSDPQSNISSKLKGRINRIIAECDLKAYSGLHRLNTTDQNTSVLLGFMNKTTNELSFDEQTELNQAIIKSILTKLPQLNAELQKLNQSVGKNTKARETKMKDLRDTLDQKLEELHEQENEKVELMMEWLNHKTQDIVKFSDNSTDMLNLKTKILDLKSKILHLQILQNIYSETNQSIKAYQEVHTDLKDSIKATEERIKQYKEIINDDKV